MFDGLDAVPWSSLQHHYGAADDLPPLLRALVEGDDTQAAHACGELENALYHQGGWIPDAATAALPYLVEAALSPRCFHPGTVLMLLAYLTQTAGEAQPENVDAGWPAAWQSAVASLEGLVGDTDHAVRVAAVAALTWGAMGPTTAATLSAQLISETDDAVRLELLLGLGATLKTHPTPAARHALEEALSSDRPQERLAAVVALSHTDPGRPFAEQHAVVDALVDQNIDVWSGTETMGSAAGVVGAATDLYAAHPQQRQALVVAVHQRNTNPTLRSVVLREAAAVMHYSRAAAPELVPLVAAYLDDEADLPTVLLALHLLAAAGPAAAAYADTIHDLGARHPEPGDPVRAASAVSLPGRWPGWLTRVPWSSSSTDSAAAGTSSRTRPYMLRGSGPSRCSPPRSLRRSSGSSPQRTAASPRLSSVPCVVTEASLQRMASGELPKLSRRHSRPSCQPCCRCYTTPTPPSQPPRR